MKLKNLIRHMFLLPLVTFISVAACKSTSTSKVSQADAVIEKGHAIKVVARYSTDASSWATEHENNPTFCIKSGALFKQCGSEFRQCLQRSRCTLDLENCDCKCEKPAALIIGATECHDFSIQKHDDGTVSIQTYNPISYHKKTHGAVLNCLTFKGYNALATYEPCSYSDEQKFFWDLGAANGYGYVKTKIGMGHNHELCLDVINSGATISFAGSGLIFSNCKNYVGGPADNSNNQRFYLDQSD